MPIKNCPVCGGNLSYLGPVSYVVADVDPGTGRVLWETGKEQQAEGSPAVECEKCGHMEIVRLGDDGLTVFVV